jgi:drug/metabolite transporter (DMT)-like permease
VLGGLVLLTTTLVIVRRILRHRYVTMQTIFGALSAYLLIGFFFAAGDAGRSMAVLEAVLGQIFLVTLVARLVALYGMVRPPRPGARD